MRIVVDTNVLVAALTRPTGSAAQIARAWREGRVELVVSEATLREAELVLGGRWLHRLATAREVEGLLQDLRGRAVRVSPQSAVDLDLKDEGDRRLVEAAVAGDAAYLITADREVLRSRGYAGTEFVTPTEFLEVLGGSAGHPRD